MKSNSNRRLLVVRNPVAGSRRDHFYIEVVTRLRDAGCMLDERSTERRGDAERFARELDAGAYDGLVIAGGDGTINEALNGLAGRDDGPAAVEFGIIPLGTANVLAVELGLGPTAYDVARALVEGTAREVALGRVNDRVFLLMAGVGFDAHVVESVPTALKRRIGKLAYALISLETMLAFPFPGYQVTIGDETMPAASIVVCNGRHYAGAYVAAPDANLEDGTLQVCLFERNGAFHTARYALNMLLGRLSKSSGYRIVPATGLRVEGPPGDPVQGDGDIIGALPAEISVDPGRVRLIYPVA